MTNNAKKIVHGNLKYGERKLYDIKKRDLQEIDRRIAEKLAENERIRRICMSMAGSTFLR